MDLKSRKELDYKAKVVQTCWDKGIKVVQKPMNRGYHSKGYPVKLNLEINGKIAKLGEHMYKQNTDELRDTIFWIYEQYYNRMD